MKKVYGVAIEKPKNPLRWIGFNRNVELIAEREATLIGFYKYTGMIVVIYENEECCKGASNLFRYFHYKCEMINDMYITQERYEWFTKFGKRCRRWR
jgi:hypothetical protein